MSGAHNTRAINTGPNNKKACGKLSAVASKAALRASRSVGVQHMR